MSFSAMNFSSAPGGWVPPGEVEAPVTVLDSIENISTPMAATPGGDRRALRLPGHPGHPNEHGISSCHLWTF